MSTVATTRPPLSIALALQASASTNELCLRRAMHPDCLVLQQHGVNSPRLSSSPKELSREAQTPSPKRQSRSMTAGMLGGEDNEHLVDEEEDGEVDGQAQEDVEDRISLCSDDSDLSVGQECEAGSDVCETESPPRQRQHIAQSVQQTQRLLCSNVGDMLALCRRPSAFSSVKSNGDASDARSSASTDDASHGADEELNANVGALPTPQVLDPFAMANALRIPVPIVPRANSSPFQEEFLRKSHLYAEELMKQQMQFMAAARASAFSLHNQLPNRQPSSPVGAAELQNFAGIQTHLSTISKISQISAALAAANHSSNQKSSDMNGGSDALAKLTALGVAHQNNQAAAQMYAGNAFSVSSLNQLQAQMQAHLPFMHNNNLNEPALKFSIDNILRADFGRRLAADPLLKRASAANAAAHCFRTSKSSPNAQRSKKPPFKSSAMDLSNLMSASTSTAGAASSTMNFSNSLANICTNSNDSSSSTAVSSSYGNASEFVKSPATLTSGGCTSPTPAALSGSEGPSEHKKTQNNETAPSSGSGSGSSSGNGPIVWPAWVYCTRYSDRPSSGPRTRKPKKPPGSSRDPSEKGASPSLAEDKRPRTAFSGSQLARLKHEFTENRYLTEKRRQQLSSELGLNEAQIKIWFQNKRAKLKKSSGTKNPLALQLMAQGLYNHSTIPLTREEEEMQELQEREREAAAAASS